MQFLVIRNLYLEVEKVPFIKESERNPKIFIKFEIFMVDFMPVT